MRRQLRGLIFDIQRFAVHDGPGIRTAVFLKGCPLRCLWCHNPEGLSAQPELIQFPGTCILCQRCVAACERGALIASPEGVRILRERCDVCGRCAAVCCTGALAISGRSMSAEEVLAEVLCDRPFYEASGGGVTITGGEPLFQWRFVRRLLRLCKEAGLHTAIETCAHGRWSSLEALLPDTDLVLLDLKIMDPIAHKTLTGVANRGILRNAERLGERGVRIIVRVPVIPGHTDSEGNLGAIARFARGIGAVGIELLPYHRLGDAKWRNLGKEAPIPPLDPIPDDRMAALRRMVEGIFRGDLLDGDHAI